MYVNKIKILEEKNFKVKIVKVKLVKIVLKNIFSIIDINRILAKCFRWRTVYRITIQ